MDELHQCSKVILKNEQPEEKSANLAIDPQTLPHGLFACDPEWRFFSVNQAAEQILGLSSKELLGRCYWDVYPEALTTHLEKEYRYCIAGEYRDFIYFHTDLDRWLHHRCIPLPAGGVLVWLEECNDPKRWDQSLMESERPFRALALASFEVIYCMSPDWSETKLLGGKNFIAGKIAPDHTWLRKYIHPDDREEVLAAIDQAIEGKSVFQMEHRVLKMDGSLGWTFSRAIPLFDEHGSVIEWFGAASDITSRKQVEQDLSMRVDDLAQQVAEQADQLRGALAALENRDKRRFQLLFDKSDTIVLMVNSSNGRIEEANRAAAEFFGYSKNDIRGMNLLQAAGVENAGDSQKGLEENEKPTVTDTAIEVPDRGFPRHNQERHLPSAFKPRWTHNLVHPQSGPDRDVPAPEGAMQPNDHGDGTMGISNPLHGGEAEGETTNQKFEELNSTLQRLLRDGYADQRRLKQHFDAGLAENVLPLLQKALRSAKGATREYLKAAQANLLDHMALDFSDSLGLSSMFSPRELQVINLVKQDRSSKEIADFLNLSVRTVEYYRMNIRQKLNISKKKKNLKKMLLSLP